MQMNGHLSDIQMNGHYSYIQTNKIEKPVAANFSQPNHQLEDLEVRGIEKIREDSTMQWEKTTGELMDNSVEDFEPEQDERG